MKRLIAHILIMLISQSSHAYTTVMASKDGMILADNNEDWKDPFTSIQFIPASDDEYGRVCFGFGNIMQNPQGDMNENSLFIDANVLSPKGWKEEEANPHSWLSNYTWFLSRTILLFYLYKKDLIKK